MQTHPIEYFRCWGQTTVQVIFFALDVYLAEWVILIVCIVAILSNELWISQRRLVG